MIDFSESESSDEDESDQKQEMTPEAIAELQKEMNETWPKRLANVSHKTIRFH